MIAGVDPSSDGKYYRVTRMDKPFSYIVQYNNFAQREELWDASGAVVTTLVTRALREGDAPVADGPTASEAADTARRNIGWLPNGAGLYFLKQDPAPPRTNGADSAEAPRAPGANGARRKDKLFAWAPPFTPGSEQRHGCGAGEQMHCPHGSSSSSRCHYRCTTSVVARGLICAVVLQRVSTPVTL